MAGADGLEDLLIPLAYGVEALRALAGRSPDGVDGRARLRARVHRRWVSLRLELARRRPGAQALDGQPIATAAIAHAVEGRLRAVDTAIAGPLATAGERAAAQLRLLGACFAAGPATADGPGDTALAMALEPFIGEWLAPR